MSERWRRVGALFDRAIAAPPHDRESMIASSGEPDDIKSEVRSLIAAHESADGFLESSAALPPPPTLAPGTCVGAYRISGVLGHGGMGVVYDAEDTRLHRRVALKALPADVAGDERQRQRLRQEARAAAALQHPGIATVYALEEFDDQIFISSEYLAGETLREEIRRGLVSPQRALAAGVELTRALCAAHDRGIVHRDLKPENIVRTHDGVLKILDFGLAQFETPARDLASKSRLTLEGALVGTPAYMAPEQLLDRPTDVRVDHFALGVLLYELSTGRHPFPGDSLPATIARILAAPPEPPPASAQMPPALWAVIDRCLQKDPAERFSSTRELLESLCTVTEAAPRLPVHGTAAAHDSAHPQASHPAPFPSGRVTDLATAGESDGVRVRWWRFHQLAAALAYWSMVWPAWHIHRSLGRFGLLFFFATLAAVVIAGNLRLHLWFSSRVYPEDLAARRADVSRWVRGADIAFAVLLIAGGLALPDDRTGWAALLVSFGIGAAVAFIFIEPATTKAAFRT